MVSLKKQTFSGLKWLVGSSFLQKAISTGTMIVLARILNPATFGLFSLAFIVIDSLGLFKSLGFDSALVRRRGDIEKAANTAFFIIPSLGLFLFLLLSLSAPFIGKFLNNSEIVNIIRVLGIIFVIGCFSKVSASLLERSMRFRVITTLEIIGSLTYSALSIAFALRGLGVWSLVIGYVAKTFIQNFLIWIFGRWRPRFEFDMKIALEMFHFGKFLFLGGVVWFLKQNLDNLLVGKLLGVTALGIYALAFNIANFGSDYFGNRVNRVMFPAYSILQDDLSDLRLAVLKTFKYVAILSIPFGVALSLLSYEFVGFVYGQKWLEAVGALKILAWAGIFNTLPTSLNSVFLVCGKPRYSFWILVLQVVLFFVFITPMVKRFGVEGAAGVVSIASLIGLLVTLRYVARLVSLKAKDFYLSLKPSLYASIFMIFGIVVTKNLLGKIYVNFSAPISFLILFCCAVAFYSIALYRCEKNIIRDIKQIIF